MSLCFPLGVFVSGEERQLKQKETEETERNTT